jgi:hypothetical protein
MSTTTKYGWTLPDGTDLIKNGDNVIRDLGNAIDAIISTVYSGTLAARPAAGKRGRTYWATDDVTASIDGTTTGTLYWDDGAAWHVVLIGSAPDNLIAAGPRAAATPNNATFGVSSFNLTWGARKFENGGHENVDPLSFSSGGDQVFRPTKKGIWSIQLNLFLDTADAARELRMKAAGGNEYMAQGHRSSSGPGAGSCMTLSHVGYFDYGGVTEVEEGNDYVFELANNTATTSIVTSNRRSRLIVAHLGS